MIMEYLPVTKSFGDYSSVHEQLTSLEQIKKFEIIKGNVLNTLPEYLTNHQETIIAMAYLTLTSMTQQSQL